MKYIMLFETFRKKDFVTYRGNKGKVVSTDGDNVEIMIFKNKGKTTTVSQDDPDLEEMKRCTGLCDKQVVEIDGERHIKCFGCDRVLTSKKKKIDKLQNKLDNKSKKKKKKKKRRGLAA
ncbi:MAG: hypothetical protein SLAVMIC_00426 [uncultured marine phage]|uniref:Uncharacterized protein n=1 Tax=uncultured marine phage TaxID=707152 RepID=A0A8D9C8W5_9VIRU|nr:MAG: hypothetical protein SLAVMIC_00426 [uncultured marine phage]